MRELVRYETGEVVTIEDAKLRYQHITTVQQALLAAQKIGVDISEIMPIAIDVLWEEVALGRFLRNMAKNKGSRIVGRNDDKSLAVVTDDSQPTVDEIVGSRDKSSLLQKIAAISDDFIEDYIDECVKNSLLPKSSDIKKKVHVSNNSGENEWYTPGDILEAARLVMHTIDLDPASSEIANRLVGAGKYYTKEDDGLVQPWFGNVWLNPPYAQPLISQFSEAIVNKRHEYKQAIILVNNATETEWFRRILKIADAICLISGRVKFLDPDGNASGAPLQGQAVLYIGNEAHYFKAMFQGLGICLWKL